MKKLLHTLLLGALSTGAMAQSNTVTGTITDCHGDPIDGQLVYIYTSDSVALDTAYYPVYYYTYTNASGLYTYDVPYTGGSQDLSVVTTQNYSPWTSLYANHTASSSGNTFTHDFNFGCDPDSIHTIIEGVVYDCSGSPLGSRWISAYGDSSLGGSGSFFYNSTVISDSITGHYSIDVTYSLADTYPLAILVSTYNPAPYPGYTTDTIYIYDTTTITHDLHTVCEPYPCEVSFYSWHDSTGIAGDTVYLFVSYASMNPAAATFSWDYGDSETGSGPYTTHTYSSEGTYTVCLTVTNPMDSCTATHCEDIEFVTLERASGVVLITNLQSTTGIKKPVKPETSFTVYPNPAESIINIRSDADIRTAKIFDMSGREVIHANMAGIQNNFNLDLNGLEKGTYLLSLYNQNNELLHTHTVLKH